MIGEKAQVVVEHFRDRYLGAVLPSAEVEPRFVDEERGRAFAPVGKVFQHRLGHRGIVREHHPTAFRLSRDEADRLVDMSDEEPTGFDVERVLGALTFQEATHAAVTAFSAGFATDDASEREAFVRRNRLGIAEGVQRIPLGIVLVGVDGSESRRIGSVE